MTLVKTLGTKIPLTTLILVNLIAVTFPACGSIPPEYKSFLELSEEKQRNEIRTYPTERQVELYLAAMRYIHPPPIGLADEIAKGGKPTLPTLLKLLREEKNKENQGNIIYLLEVMHRCCHDLQNEKEVVSFLEELSNNEKDSNLKSRSDEALRFIVHGQMPDVIKLLNGAKEDLSK